MIHYWHDDAFNFKKHIFARFRVFCSIKRQNPSLYQSWYGVHLADVISILAIDSKSQNSPVPIDLRYRG